MFEGDSADICAGKFLLTPMGSRAEGLVCADPGARTPQRLERKLKGLFIENWSQTQTTFINGFYNFDSPTSHIVSPMLSIQLDSEPNQRVFGEYTLSH